MFGYINVNREELSEENKKIYQAYYCGLCQRLHANCGKKGQMLLNYDMTFLVVLLTGLYEVNNTQKKFTCILHPTKKKTAYENEISDYCAAMNVMLAYYNLIDDWQDEKNYTKKTLANMIRKDYNRFAEQYPRQTKALEQYITRLSEYEKNEETNIDLVAGLTGEMLGELFAWKEDEWYEELKTLGYYMGKFIYLMDAYEDIDKDEKHKSYNPLCMLRKENPKDFETLCRLMMTSMMAECAKSFERLPILLHADILRNILYSGVWSKYEYIQLKKKKRTKK
ncbi:MAG: class 1 isoprenoid biosynthesis enzyme [Lachnospiraceae bacterium]|nr:class 1 isoprenoid biosynthesis enzyme [Lachnospiraceae bacterium]